MFQHYIMVAFRNLVRSRSFSLINISGLAFGLACSLLIFLWARDEQSVDRFHTNNKLLYRVYLRQVYDGQAHADYHTPAPLPAELKKMIPEIEYATGFVKFFRLSLQDDIYESFSVDDKVYKLKGSRAEEDFFSMFSYKLLYGTPQTALSRPESLCMSRKMAELFFGSVEAAVGKTVRFDGRTDVTVTAVFENLPPQASDQFDYLMNWDAWVAENPFKQSWGHFGTLSFIQLRPDADPVKVEEKIKDFLKTYLKGMSDNLRLELGLQPFGDQYLYGDFENGLPAGGRILYVNLFMGVGIFILLIACINFMNLATARSVKRAKEVGVRKVVGSSRLHLIYQFIGEAMLLTLMAVLLSLALAALSLPAFNDLTAKQMAIPLREPLFYLFMLGLVLLTGFIAGSYPALFLSSLQPVKVLKGHFRFSFSAAAFRKGLVVFQFVLSMLLLISTLVVTRQTNYLQYKNLGYDRENVLYIPIEGNLITKYALFREEASKIPGIKMVDRSSQFPHAMSFRVDAVQWPGRDPNKVINFAVSSVGYDFVKLMNLDIVNGRDVDRYNRTDSVGFLVNEEAVRQMGVKDPIGMEISVFGKQGRIVGVLKDYHTNTLHQAIDPVVLDVKEFLNFGTVLVRTEKGKLKEALAGLEKVYKQMNPGHAFNFTFMDEQYGKLYKSEQVASKLSYVFTLLAIVISCLGLLGLSMFAAEQWKKEIGIRKILGATLRHIMARFSGDFVRLVLLSIVIAVPPAWLAMNQWLQNFAYRIDLAWWIFVLAGIIALVVSLLTVSTQAVKAALENPVKNLRSE
ncbi:ABC transporter permease [Fulvivirgaceae bacterium PWU4]|uniref:ABC transporter permease n=2 Tax=Chryseosolibacter histidini TaxID=2782349 RepID=A0AAP2DRM6_9BACT|nr:ABC transporter permease [Chryseosolibacter histidini]